MFQKLRLLVGICCFLLAAFCLFTFFDTSMQESAADALYARAAAISAPLPEIQQSSPLPVSIQPLSVVEGERFLLLVEQFPDLVGWISGPDLDYPIVQGEDDAFYLTHLADGTPNPTGAIFLSSGAPPDFSGEISCIYGHALTRGTMFSGLSRYRELEFCQQNPSFLLETPDGVAELTILGVCLRDGTSPYPTEFPTPESRADFLSWVKEHSLVALDIPDRNKPLVILSTCAYDFENARLAVVTQLEWKERNGEI